LEREAGMAIRAKGVWVRFFRRGQYFQRLKYLVRTGKHQYAGQAKIITCEPNFE
jgi:hypothetical protein